MHTRTPISTPTQTHRHTKRNTDTRWEFNLCSPLSSLMSFYAISLTGIIKDRKRRANYYAANVGLLLSSCYPSIPPSPFISPLTLSHPLRMLYRVLGELSRHFVRRDLYLICHLASKGASYYTWPGQGYGKGKGKR